MSSTVAHNMYFVALVCPSSVDEKIRPFKYWMRDHFNCVVALRSPAHITLVPPFWLEESREDELKHAVQAFFHDLSEIEIQLQDFSHFGRRVIFISVCPQPALEIIKALTENHFVQKIGDTIKKDDRPFRPHITIANRDLRPHDFNKAWQHFSRKKFLETFHIKTISLLKHSPGKWNIIAEKSW